MNKKEDSKVEPNDSPKIPDNLQSASIVVLTGISQGPVALHVHAATSNK